MWHLIEHPLQVGGQPMPAVHVPKAAAFEGGDDIVSVGDDQRADLVRGRSAEDDPMVELRPDRHHEVA